MTATRGRPGMAIAVVVAAVAAILAISGPAALADGGTVILHRDAGAFSVTLFAPGMPIEVGETDLSVLVQARASGEVLVDPVVDLTTVAAGSNAAPDSARLTHGTTGNRLLQAADVNFPRPGKWLVTVNVRRGAERATLTTELIVEPNHSRAKMVWFYLLLPVAVILLFVAHQVLRRKQSVRASPGA